MFNFQNSPFWQFAAAADSRNILGQLASLLHLNRSSEASNFMVFILCIASRPEFKTTPFNKWTMFIHIWLIFFVAHCFDRKIAKITLCAIPFAMDFMSSVILIVAGVVVFWILVPWQTDHCPHSPTFPHSPTSVSMTWPGVETGLYYAYASWITRVLQNTSVAAKYKNCCVFSWYDLPRK